MIPRLVMFDLDGTLTESKQPITEAASALLARLLAVTNVAIVSGGALAQFLKQVVARLPVEAALNNLYLLPTSGAALYEFRDDGWRKVYEERLSEREKDSVEAAIILAIEETGIIDLKEPAWGERVEYRGSQVTLSALGQDAPIAEKKAWDPDHAKRRALQAAIGARLPEFLVSMGGATSIDVTRRGIDKAYGIRKLCERLCIRERDALYVGDELRSGGNDEAVYKTEVTAKNVADPAETMELIEGIVKAA